MSVDFFVLFSSFAKVVFLFFTEKSVQSSLESRRASMTVMDKATMAMSASLSRKPRREGQDSVVPRKTLGGFGRAGLRHGATGIEPTAVEGEDLIACVGDNNAFEGDAPGRAGDPERGDDLGDA